MKEQEQEQEDAGREARWGRSGAVDEGEVADAFSYRMRSGGREKVWTSSSGRFRRNQEQEQN
jgi:hypothetical protein